MRVDRRFGPVAATLLLSLAGCGKSSSSSSSGVDSTAASSPGVIRIVEGTAPDSLDPGVGETMQAAEADWLAYTGLTTYAHQRGIAGGRVIPGLATALPLASGDGRTYTATLRRGLSYPDGRPVKASDFPYTIERSLKLLRGGVGRVYANTIVGAAAYATGSSDTISGITADDATGTITIRLRMPDRAFEDVLALPSSGLVPATTPVRNLPENPPPGVGPYMISNVLPGASFSLIRNPRWASEQIPGIPSGHSNIQVTIDPDVHAHAGPLLDKRIDRGSAVFNPQYGWDWSTLTLK